MKKTIAEGGTIRPTSVKLLPSYDWAKLLKQGLPVPMHYKIEGDYTRAAGEPVLRATLTVNATDGSGNLRALGIERVNQDGTVDVSTTKDHDAPAPAEKDGQCLPMVSPEYQQAFGMEIPVDLLPVLIGASKDVALKGLVTIIAKETPASSPTPGLPVFCEEGYQCVRVYPEGGFEPKERSLTEASGPTIRLVRHAAKAPSSRFARNQGDSDPV